MNTAAPAPAETPGARRGLRGAARAWWRDAGFLAGSAVTAILAVLVWNLLIWVALLLVIAVLTIPAAIVVAGAWRRLIDVDRAMVAARDGRPITVAPVPQAGVGATRGAQLQALLGSRRFWLDLLWLLYQSSLGLVLQLTALFLPAVTITSWAVLAGGGRSELVDLLDGTGWEWAAELRAVVAAGVLLTLLSLAVVPLVARLHAAIGRVLLFDREGDEVEDPRAAHDPAAAAGATSASLPSAGDALASHVALVVGIGVLTSGVWLLGGASGPVWPAWVWFAGGCTIGLHILWIRSLVVTRLVLLRDLAIALTAVVLLIWGLSGGGTFWPRWPIAGAWALYGAIWLATNGDTWARSSAMRSRIDELTTSRREVVDTQAEELRRIERDLHDGAQARLVALSMQLGRAEAKLADDDRPEAALVAAARQEALAAIRELRDLARGIAPPILQARGLVAAVEALAERTPIEATVSGVVEPRPPAAVESCAYFVCAESLTNVAKHAHGATARIELARTGNLVRAQIADDGPGGAVPAGGGLEGLRRRVAALDGTLTIESPRGGGTIVTVELPCES